jgi:hypothetical protein
MHPKDRSDIPYAWRQGYRAYQTSTMADKLRSHPLDNPHRPGQAHRDWDSGWYYAQDEDGVKT